MAFDLKNASASYTTDVTEKTLLRADVNGQVLSVERLTLYNAPNLTYTLRRYIDTTLVWQWGLGVVVGTDTTSFSGPWNLIGDADNPQDLRIIISSGTPTGWRWLISYSIE